ncbi:MAG: hypothetical protein R2771_05645 [Saprospiraceae bacterium]
MQNNIIHIKNITEAHRLFNLPTPKHPQVSIFRHKDLHIKEEYSDQMFTMDLYMIAMKDTLSGKLKYGRKLYDFQEGTLVFIAPHQVFSGASDIESKGDDWVMLFDENFIRMSELGTTIDDYHFFSYDADEALHLSDDEKKELTEIAMKIEKEYQQHIDKHTQEIILINLESFLKYSQRFYDRQFITRKKL